jgi:hypothetical protein
MLQSTEIKILSKKATVTVIAFVFCLIVNSNNLFGNSYIKLEKAVITVDIKDVKKYNIAVFFQEEVFKRTGIKLAISSPSKNQKLKEIRLLLRDDKLTLNKDNLINKAESYSITVNNKDKNKSVVNILGSDYRGLLFGVGRLIRMLYLSKGYISVSDNLSIQSSPSDQIRAQQIIANSQGKDGFKDWQNPKDNQGFVNDMILFGTNGFEPTKPELVDDYLESLDINLFIKLKCDDIIGLNKKSNDEISDFFKSYVGVDHITSYGGDAAGAVEPQLFFPYLDKVIPLLLKNHPNSKWWYSNQCLADHSKDNDDYIFSFIKENQPKYLYGMVYGPWTKRGISEIRKDLPSQYIIRHFPDICHPRWAQYPVPNWDRALSIVWPRNKSIYMMPKMMLNIYKSTRSNTIGFLPYNHTGSYNDLNKVVWSSAGWDSNISVNEVLYDYAKAFISYDFIKVPIQQTNEIGLTKEDSLHKATLYVAKGLELLEGNWVGSLNENSTAELAFKYWKNIAEGMGNTEKNWRVKMFLYKARIDLQIKRKYDAEMQLQAEVYNFLKTQKNQPIELIKQKSKQIFEKIDDEFQSKSKFIQELNNLGLSDGYGDLEEVINNIYTSFSDRYWLMDKLENAKNVSDIDAILNYQNVSENEFYDNLGVEGEQPHLVRQKSWQEDPGFVYSPIEWVDTKSNSKERNSQLTHALTRYDSPLIMRWNGLDKDASYQIKVIYNGPFDIKLKCQTDDDFMIHDFIKKTNNSIQYFLIPKKSTSDGSLELRWIQDKTDIMRGVSVSEIWLIKS